MNIKLDIDNKLVHHTSKEKFVRDCLYWDDKGYVQVYHEIMPFPNGKMWVAVYSKIKVLS